MVIKTTGDDRSLIDADVALKTLGGKGLFTKEIEEDMLSGRIDIAVHSMKDMPVAQPEGLVLDCYLPPRRMCATRSCRWPMARWPICPPAPRWAPPPCAGARS